MTIRDEIIEQVNRLFIYTDKKDWKALEEDIFGEEVYIDMESAGGAAGSFTSLQACEMWQSALEALDAINHLTGNFIVESISQSFAKVFCYATASHYMASAKNGTTREFIGDYDIELSRQGGDWKVTFFKYNLKYMTGNLDLS